MLSALLTCADCEPYRQVNIDWPDHLQNRDQKPARSWPATICKNIWDHMGSATCCFDDACSHKMHLCCRRPFRGRWRTMSQLPVRNPSLLRSPAAMQRWAVLWTINQCLSLEWLGSLILATHAIKAHCILCSGVFLMYEIQDCPTSRA